MEKIEKIIRTVEDVTHCFYCDDCNKYLGESKEYDDGLYRELGEYELHFGNCYIKKCLCVECREKLIEKIDNALMELGFKHY